MHVNTDGIIYIGAYYLLFGLGVLFLGVTMLVVGLPANAELGDDFAGSGVVIAFMSLLSILTGLAAFFSVWGLWQLRPAGRTVAMTLAVFMLLIAIPMTPMFVFEDYGLHPLAALAGGVLVILASSGTLWYLTRPSIKHLFFAKPKPE